ncbi:TPA: P63C domain-containing protein [Klebsiella aerogenes]|jgi:hypothetical protein|uniref:P63C domain-containing protein n=1 Tax=Enterobacter mori TaxID=539813 RepID=A0A7T0DYR6_9ENTR|nr:MULTISPECIES: P63C domain-containing protein [Enterobacter]MCG3100484.1 P63C domain-containing protein [Enterobacter sp. DRP3]HDU6133108.1 P63C domain-containing protein [Klebsiella aerogenes]MCK7376239.1 P63C domain-containing protein [Enterobacter bugandensis]QPK01877.1 P63C domain-containing protein [Enterobacter mori]WBN87220.1 P63C domain-containing protein [Enterobacter kobei]
MDKNDIDSSSDNPLERKKASYSGKLHIGNLTLNCYVTEDGERFISGRSMTAAIGMKGRGVGMLRIAEHTTLRPYMNNSLIRAIKTPLEIHGKTPVAVHGYRAEILADICDAILDARNGGRLKTEQEMRYGDHAELLVRAFARVGIAALVDEATGYQEVREKDALQRILDKFLNPQARAWSKTFPDEFWQKLVKMRGYDSYLAIKRPAFIGHWVNDYVYARLAPGVLPTLKEINPRNESGSGRKRKHHSHLTEDHGLPELKEHLKKLMLLMDISKNRQEFEKLLDRAAPKFGNTLELDYEDDE